MAIYSMTGYARSEGMAMGSRVTVEVKSVNHRYLDFKVHLPREILVFEDKILELGRGFFNRGRVEVWVDYLPGERPLAVRWNRPLAEGIVQALTEMKQALSLAGEPELSLLAAQKDVILVQDPGSGAAETWPEWAEIFRNSFRTLQEMRAREGEALAADVRARLAEIEKRVGLIEAAAAGVVSAYQEKLEKRMKELLGERANLDEGRLAQEAALLADRSDITEELVRLKSHFLQFREVMAAEGPKGRKLDFLLQEFFREINTVGSKAGEAAISRLIVEMKTELEKIREQVQNLE